MYLHPASPHAIDRWRAEIVSISKSTNEPELFDNVKKACLNRRAFLFVCSDGFAVLEPVVRDSIGRGVNIWLAFSRDQNTWGKYLPDVENLTRNIGGSYVELSTARKGYFRRAPKYGLELVGEPEVVNGATIYTWRKRLWGRVVAEAE